MWRLRGMRMHHCNRSVNRFVSPSFVETIVFEGQRQHYPGHSPSIPIGFWRCSGSQGPFLLSICGKEKEAHGQYSHKKLELCFWQDKPLEHCNIHPKHLNRSMLPYSCFNNITLLRANMYLSRPQPALLDVPYKCRSN